MGPKKTNVCGIISLICGIIGMIICCYPIVTIVCAVIGITLAIVGMAAFPECGKGIAIAGLCCNIAAVCILIVILLFNNYLDNLFSELGNIAW